MKINIIDLTIGFGPDFKFITSLTTILYAFLCHAGIFPVISGLVNPTERVNSFFKRATIINTISYIIIALSGYFTQPQNTHDLILEREKLSDTDYLMTFSLIMFSVTIAIKIGALFNCLRSLL